MQEENTNMAEKNFEMKCINGPYRCSRIGYSGGKECCGYLLATGETKFVGSAGIINEPCPLNRKAQIYLDGSKIEITIWKSKAQKD